MAIPVNIYEDLGIEYIDPEDILDEYSIDEIKSMENGDLLLGVINSFISEYVQNEIVFKLISLNSFYEPYINGEYDNDGKEVKEKILNKLNSLIIDLSFEYQNYQNNSGIWKYIDKSFDEFIEKECKSKNIDYKKIFLEIKTIERDKENI